MPVMPALFQRTARRAGSASVLLLVVPLLLGADDDNDLRAIEDEAKRQAVTLNLGPPPVDAARPADSSAALSTDGERLPAGLDAAAFARALREGSPAIFTLYQRLDAASQQRVYQSYQNDSRLSNVSAQIAQALSNGSGNRKP